VITWPVGLCLHPGDPIHHVGEAGYSLKVYTIWRARGFFLDNWTRIKTFTRAPAPKENFNAVVAGGVATWPVKKSLPSLARLECQSLGAAAAEPAPALRRRSQSLL